MLVMALLVSTALLKALEDVIDILLNIKDIPVKVIEGDTAEIVLDVTGPSTMFLHHHLKSYGNVELVDQDFSVASIIDKVNKNDFNC